MIASTKAIVLSSLKYSDSSLIVKCITREYGAKSYLLQGILSNKKGNVKPAYFLPFTQLEIVANHKNQGTLERIKEVRIAYPYQSVHTDIYKSSVIMFLSEICNHACNHEYSDIPLFDFIEKTLQNFDRSDFNANFHLKFLVELTRYLGIYPYITDDGTSLFDIEEGKMLRVDYSEQHIDGKILDFFKELLTTDFQDLPQLKISREHRRFLLSKILNYYEWHSPGFRKSRSLEVLHSLFT